MRHSNLTSLVLLLAVAGGASSAVAGEIKTRRAPDPYAELILPAAEVSAAIEPWRPDIRACWLKHATRRARNDGHLRIQLIIDPVGMAWHYQLAYAGGKSRAFDRCVDRVIEQVRCPMRRGYTRAAIPFIFRASAGPGTTPIMSCYNPRGCRRRPER